MKRYNNAINFGDGLVLLLTYLKLTNQVSFSWWVVLSPFWLPLIVTLAVLLIDTLYQALNNA